MSGAIGSFVIGSSPVGGTAPVVQSLPGTIGGFIIGTSDIGGMSGTAATTQTAPTTPTSPPVMCDFYLEWNSDFILTPNGSIQTAVNWDRVRERIIRRFLTNPARALPDGSTTPPDYVFDPSYGFGAGALVDQNPTAAWRANLQRQMRQSILVDSAVDPGSVPTIGFVSLGHAWQIIATVKLLNGQPGQIAITIG